MADKTYKMQVTLTDNRVLDAGTFVAPQGPQGPQGPAGSSSPILLSQNYNDGSGNVVLSTSGTMYYTKRSNTGALSGTQGGASVNNLTLGTTDEYFIIIKGTGSNISLENDDGTLVNITTPTYKTFVKASPEIDDGGTSFNITIISEYYPS